MEDNHIYHFDILSLNGLHRCVPVGTALWTQWDWKVRRVRPVVRQDLRSSWMAQFNKTFQRPKLEGELQFVGKRRSDLPHGVERNLGTESFTPGPDRRRCSGHSGPLRFSTRRRCEWLVLRDVHPGFVDPKEVERSTKLCTRSNSW